MSWWPRRSYFLSFRPLSVFVMRIISVGVKIVNVYRIAMHQFNIKCVLVSIRLFLVVSFGRTRGRNDRGCDHLRCSGRGRRRGRGCRLLRRF